MCSYMPLNELILSDKGISVLEESTQTMLEIDAGVFCDKRNNDVKYSGKQVINYILNDLLIFEIDLNIYLNDITITLQGKLFSLFSVIEYLPNIRHYVSHCKHIEYSYNKWESYDDLSSRQPQQRKKCKW